MGGGAFSGEEGQFSGEIFSWEHISGHCFRVLLNFCLIFFVNFSLVFLMKVLLVKKRVLKRWGKYLEENKQMLQLQ